MYHLPQVPTRWCRFLSQHSMPVAHHITRLDSAFCSSDQLSTAFWSWKALPSLSHRLTLDGHS